MKNNVLSLVLFISGGFSVYAQPNKAWQKEKYRPQVHFTPKANWMNDPNGMLYYHGTYHLFYQYYPNATVWGPMHWGHATSSDILHWQHQPVALYPDSLGYIFSGSAVADTANTSGFGTTKNPPLVAIYTSHDALGEKAGSDTFQNQSIAYSIDSGKTWVKYAQNPVLKNPGIRDFRDPKVSWYQKDRKWIMTLATQDRVTFYSSKNLKNWTKESEFGVNIGAHGGVWECPDLFTLKWENETKYVLVVSINPGGPNGGSATQYFTGDFDGHQFVPADTITRWIDYGPDNYAGVTWSNTAERKIFLGWMSNWNYANQVPTKTWRSANTIPRQLKLEKQGKEFLLASTPVAELKKLAGKTVTITKSFTGNVELSETVKGTQPAMITFSSPASENIAFEFYNSDGETIAIGFDASKNEYFIDRSASGNTTFSNQFATRSTAPRLSLAKGIKLTLLVDESSVELFGDEGLTVMTALFFPKTNYTKSTLKVTGKKAVNQLSYTPLISIYK